MSEFNWSAYEHWNNRLINQDAAEKGWDHDEDGCEVCHENHRARGIFEDRCQTCRAEQCPDCRGLIWVPDQEGGEMECPRCGGTGWITI